jgi:hypothetical protein
MDQRELDSRVKALQKAIAEKEPASNVITIMEMLKNNVTPTEELLRVCYTALGRLPGRWMQIGFAAGSIFKTKN